MSAVKIRKVGGSLMLALPVGVAKQIGAGAGDVVHIEVRDDALVVRAAKRKYVLADLLAESPRKFDVDRDWDRAVAVGKEGI